ncbi:MFS transporter [Amycolatopsis sp. NPDC023774]|uniref:MFS transporter n=1 Tax=Amycolatopsis sp. NPDC023774 TaxID=3155015 RepID=UPI0033FC8F78
MPVLPYLLALAVFAQGTSEFMVSGLVPEVARDLGVSLAAAGSLTAVFAMGMVIGAPALAIAGRGWSQRAALLGYLGVFVAVHVAAALAPGFGILLATRLVSALATAGFLAVALTAAADAAPGGEGRATAVVLAGTTLACVAGVPAGAVLGQVWGWRSAFWAVALVSVPAFAAIARWAPRAQTASTPVKAEFAVLKRPRVVAALGRGALVNGATFAVFTYLAPLASSAEGRLPILLELFGIGACAGVALAGRRPATRKTQLVLAVGWLGLALGAGNATVLLVFVPLQALLSFAVGSTAVAQVLRAAPDAPALRGAFATAALNVGAAAGPWLAATLLGTGYRAPVCLAVVLATTTLVIREQCS